MNAAREAPTAKTVYPSGDRLVVESSVYTTSHDAKQWLAEISSVTSDVCVLAPPAAVANGTQGALIQREKGVGYVAGR